MKKYDNFCKTLANLKRRKGRAGAKRNQSEFPTDSNRIEVK